MIVRRLNDAGLRRFEQFLDSLTTNRPESCAKFVLEDAGLTESLDAVIDVEPREFFCRFDIAAYLFTKLGDAGLPNIERDVGLWSWLALFYFESLCRPGPDGRRKPGERARWIPAVREARRYYRHLLAGPFLIYRAHRDDPTRAMVLLFHRPHEVGHFMYQLASRKEIIINSAVVETATKLYYDAKTKRAKRGSQSQHVPGSVFRFAAILNQFDLTWDLQRVTSSQLVTMLPSEFDQFREKSAR